MLHYILKKNKKKVKDLDGILNLKMINIDVLLHLMIHVNN